MLKWKKERRMEEAQDVSCSLMTFGTEQKTEIKGQLMLKLGETDCRLDDAA